MNSASLLRIWASKLSRIRASGRVEVLSVVCCLGVDVLARRDDVLADDLGAASAAAAGMVESRRTCHGVHGCVATNIVCLYL